MGHLQIGRVEYRNFGPFEEAVADFSLPGLTGVEGVIDWKPGSDSNGSGKSMLVDGISWCLFGRGLRDSFTGSDVVRVSSDCGCLVIADIVGGEHLYRIMRYRDNPTHKNRLFLYVDGKDVSRGTDPETQQLIVDTIGLDFHTFSNTVAFGAREDVRSFFSASDSTRKAILERMLGLELYARAQAVARQTLKEKAATATKLAVAYESAKAKLDQAISNAQAVESYGDLGDLALQMSKAQLRVKRLTKVVTKREAQMAKAKDLFTAAKVGAENAVDAWQAQCDANDEQRSLLRKEISRLKGVAVQENTKWKTALARRKKLESLDAECPTCEQPVPEDNVLALVDELSAEMSACTDAREKAMSKVASLEDELDAIVDEEMPVPYEVTLATTDLDVVACSLSEAQGALKEAKATANGAAALWEKAKAHHDQSFLLVEKLTKAASKSVKEYDSVAWEMARLEFWVDGFGNAGLKSFLIEAAIPDINARATKYAQILLGPGAEVRLSATTKLKSKKDAVREKLSVEGRIPGCCETYAGASKGQKRRLDLALLLAFREVIESRSMTPFRQFMADELFDGLDKSGCESVAYLLKDVSETCPVTLVTHSPWLKSVVDRVVTVRHVEEYRAVVETPKGMLQHAQTSAKTQPKPAKKKVAKKKARSLGGKNLKAKLVGKPPA